MKYIKENDNHKDNLIEMNKTFLSGLEGKDTRRKINYNHYFVIDLRL